MRDYLEQLERFAFAKAEFDAENEHKRIELLMEFAEKEGWIGDYAKRKLRELASGPDESTVHHDISGLISHG